MLGIENVVELSRAPKRRNTYYSVLAGRDAVNAKVACYSGSLVLVIVRHKRSLSSKCTAFSEN